MEMVVDGGGSVAELITVLEQATLTAKQLPTTTDPSQILRLHSTLHSAHHHLSLFLSQPQNNPPAENSVSSAVSGGDNETDPMQLEGEEHNSKVSVDVVEERMRDCFIQNKRPKRPLSPAAAAEPPQSYESEVARSGSAAGFDPIGYAALQSLLMQALQLAESRSKAYNDGVILTVGGRPRLPRASSISWEGQMCLSEFRSILRFPLKAELT
nr:uncharacterized protein LOC109155629 [Ipomoea batatas]